MSYNINFQDLTSLYSGAAANINSWQESLTSIYEDMNYVFAQENFKGAAADSIKNYISQVHFTVISSITGLLSEYSAMLLLYLDGLYTYDAGPIATLNEVQMTELADRFSTVLGDIDESHELCVGKMSSISDLTDLNLSSLDTYTSILEEAKTRLVAYRDGIGEYDNDYAVNKLPSFVERLNETVAVIEKLREIKEFDPLTYDAGNLIPLEQLQKVCENAEASYTYLEENAANIDAAVEHQQEVYAQIEEMLAQQRKEEGYRKLFMGAVILTTFVLTAGVATPVAVAGIPMVAYGSSMASEGLQDIYYGEMGDISTESFNFVRDTVFGGDQDKYDFFGAVATSAYSVAVPLGSLYTSAASTSVSIVASRAQTATVLINTGVDVGVESVVEILCDKFGASELTTLVLSLCCGTIAGFGVDRAIKFGKMKNVTKHMDSPSLFGDMSPDDAARYADFMQNGSKHGLTDIELYGVNKVDDYLALNKVDYDDVLKLRNKTGVEGGNTSKIGDFSGLNGSNVDDILDRIPDDAVLRELTPVNGGATEGFEFKWIQDGQTYRVRVHNPDPSAPIGTNAYNNWVVRVQRGRQYYDYTIDDFQPAKFTNPNGDFFDESIMNNTHIPIQNPYD